MKIVTWNVNSIRARKERALAWLEKHKPDALCLQETKVENDVFPAEDFESAGYRFVHHGQRAYNGVAILTPHEPENAIVGMGGAPEFDEDSRVISAEIQGIRVVSVYVPNGNKVGTDKYLYKLGWFAELRSYFERNFDPSQPVVLVGDFNVAPDERDLYDSQGWQGSILCSDPERNALQKVVDWGFTDAFRMLHDGPGLFSWWDYRHFGFKKNRGLRIDHIYITDCLKSRVVASEIDKDERKGKGASDHAPVWLELSAS